MRKRRFSHVSTSSEEEEEEEQPRIKRSKSKRNKQRKKEEEEEEDEEVEEEIEKSKSPEKEEEAEEEEEEEDPVAVPIGDPVRVSGKGRWKKKHYSSFEYEGNIFELEDPVLLTPETQDEKPYVAIIKCPVIDISKTPSSLVPGLEDIFHVTRFEEPSDALEVENEFTVVKQRSKRKKRPNSRFMEREFVA